jgi:nucleoside 2-deoxyribosyltransferase
MRRAFLAIPVTDSLASTGRFRAERRRFLESFVTVLEDRQFEVASAGTNERWGEIKLTSAQFTRYDIDAIAKADCLVIVTNERLNHDMYLELGLAAAREIPIVAIVAASTPLTFMAEAMEELGLIKVCRYDSESEASALLDAAMKEVIEELESPAAAG